MGARSIRESVVMRWVLFFCLAAFVAGLCPLTASAGKAQYDNLRVKETKGKPVQKEIASDLQQGPGDEGEDGGFDEVSSSEEDMIGLQRSFRHMHEEFLHVGQALEHV